MCHAYVQKFTNCRGIGLLNFIERDLLLLWNSDLELVTLLVSNGQGPHGENMALTPPSSHNLS